MKQFKYIHEMNWQIINDPGDREQRRWKGRQIVLYKTIACSSRPVLLLRLSVECGGVINLACFWVFLHRCLSPCHYDF